MSDVATPPTTGRFRVGTDIGGTFTDLVLLEDGIEPRRTAAGAHHESDVHQLSLATRLTSELELRQYACPSCGVLLAVDISRPGDPIVHDIELVLS